MNFSFPWPVECEAITPPALARGVRSHYSTGQPFRILAF